MRRSERARRLRPRLHARPDLALQQDALTGAGCERIFADTASGATAERPGLEEALNFAGAGNTLAEPRPPVMRQIAAALAVDAHQVAEFRRAIADHGQAARRAHPRSLRAP